MENKKEDKNIKRDEQLTKRIERKEDIMKSPPVSEKKYQMQILGLSASLSDIFIPSQEVVEYSEETPGMGYLKIFSPNWKNLRFWDALTQISVYKQLPLIIHWITSPVSVQSITKKTVYWIDTDISDEGFYLILKFNPEGQLSYNSFPYQLPPFRIIFSEAKVKQNSSNKSDGKQQGKPEIIKLNYKKIKSGITLNDLIDMLLNPLRQLAPKMVDKEGKSLGIVRIDIDKGTIPGWEKIANFIISAKSLEKISPSNLEFKTGAEVIEGIMSFIELALRAKNIIGEKDPFMLNYIVKIKKDKTSGDNPYLLIKFFSTYKKEKKDIPTLSYGTSNWGTFTITRLSSKSDMSLYLGMQQYIGSKIQFVTGKKIKKALEAVRGEVKGKSSGETQEGSVKATVPEGFVETTKIPAMYGNNYVYYEFDWKEKNVSSMVRFVNSVNAYIIKQGLQGKSLTVHLFGNPSKWRTDPFGGGYSIGDKVKINIQRPISVIEGYSQVSPFSGLYLIIGVKHVFTREKGFYTILNLVKIAE